MVTCAPMTTPSPSSTPSPRCRPGASGEGSSMRRHRPARTLQLALESLEDAHDAQPALAVADRDPLGRDALEEVRGDQPQRLDVRDAWAPDVARPRDVLAVAVALLVEALVVDGELALVVHVVEGGHPPRADDGEAPLLVRVQPRKVQVRRQPGREAQ